MSTHGDNDTTDKQRRRCRVLVVASSRPRLAKVMGLLLPMELSSEMEQDFVSVEYLPCVATFDSYEDEKGNKIRYLISVNYHGHDGSQQAGTSLAPFFDEEPLTLLPPEEENDRIAAKPRENLGILGAAIGSGIENEEDVERIRVFFQTLRKDPPLQLKVIQPNPEYATMKEETEAFKALSPEAKEEAALRQSIGPGKMAKFVHDFTAGLVQNILDKEEAARARTLAEQQERERLQQEQQQSTAAQLRSPSEIDSTKPRYACRKCRTVLFGQDDMEDPPHVAAKHQFRSRKGNAAATTCQSWFLSDSVDLDWMADMMISGEMEGRFNCPKCQFKLGTWHWQGAQCSCGTWVSPALQIPKSKVDVLPPPAISNSNSNTFPPGTIISPFAVAAYQQSQAIIPS